MMQRKHRQIRNTRVGNRGTTVDFLASVLSSDLDLDFLVGLEHTLAKGATNEKLPARSGLGFDGEGGPKHWGGEGGSWV
jgi:hypothetical protein